MHDHYNVPRSRQKKLGVSGFRRNMQYLPVRGESEVEKSDLSRDSTGFTLVGAEIEIRISWRSPLLHLVAIIISVTLIGREVNQKFKTPL
jgi:hypothetical protein